MVDQTTLGKLAKAPVNPVQATLAKIDGSVIYTFLLNPEETNYNHSAEYSKLPVLSTGQPLVSYRSSESSIDFPSVKLWTDGNDRDLTPLLKQLTDWTKPEGNVGEPALLKFTWGAESFPRVKIASWSYRVTQRRSGKPVEATGSLVLLLAPETPKAIMEAPKAELTEREQKDNRDKVVTQLKTNKAQAKKLGVDPIKDQITVGKDGKVTSKDVKGVTKDLGDLKTILGDTLKPGLTQVKPATGSKPTAKK